MKIELKDEIFDKIIDFAAENNFEVYVIGGFVRDLLLKKKSKDIDFVIVGDGTEFAYRFAKKLNPKIKVNIFKNFGTANFVYKGLELEFVGARKESYNRYSRKPKVVPGTLEDDQKRRDFTINALAISLNKSNLYELLDPFDGLKHLRQKIIKTPLDPDITFSDDPLRMMRAIRFATTLDFDIDPETFYAIERNKDRIKIVSTERISDELNKIMLAQKPSKGFMLLSETGLLDIIFPELAALKGIETINGISHKDIFLHTLKVLDQLASHTDNLWLRWAALLHDIGKPATKRFINNKWTFYGHQNVGAKMIPAIFKRMRLPMNEKMKYVRKLVAMHHRPTAVASDKITDSAIRRLIYEAGNDIDDLMLLVENDITTQYNEKRDKFIKNYHKLRKRMDEILEKDFIRNWQPPIDGNMIMEIFGIPPSKIVGELKNAVKDAILDGEIKNDANEAYNYLLKIAKEKYNILPKNKKNEQSSNS